MKEFNAKIQKKFTEMSQSGKLFRVKLTGQEIWDLYLGSFSKEHDPVFRDPNSTVHNCNHCKNFVRRYGNIVSIDESYKIQTMFDVSDDDEFANTVKVLTKAIKASEIVDVFVETFDELNSLPYEVCKKSSMLFQLGTASNQKRYNQAEADMYGVVKPNEIRTFDHMYLSVDRQFIDMSGSSDRAIMGSHRDDKNVFQTAMEKISLDTLNLVKDLINQGSLLNGAAHVHKIDQIIPMKEEYDSLAAAQRNNWCWVKSFKLPFARFGNELIGVLCTELSEGEELNKACQSWNKRVDPANYMKVTAPITQKQIAEAAAFVADNGYTESFNRRFATIDDIKVSEILHSNVGDGTIKSVSIFDGVKPTSTRHKRNEFDGVEDVTIEKFMKDILPTCSSVEAFFTGAHAGNLVSLTTANVTDSKPIFKWDNNYSWTFRGNLAGKSQIKEAVKTAGGKVDGILRFSIMWAEGDGDNSDLDAHCIEPMGEIYFANLKLMSGGNLDVDITQPQSQAPKGAVENITYPSLSKMRNGKYKFYVHQYSGRGSRGFKAEIEFNGESYSYEYPRSLGQKENVHVAEVTLKDGVFTIVHKLEASAASSREIYGIETNQFHKVNLVCLSPNHWGTNKVGNKHYFFMIDGCKSPEAIRSFHNENLLPELAAHRKVLEVLGATNMIEPANKQLTGLGFNATVKDELIVRLQGTHKRVVKIKF